MNESLDFQTGKERDQGSHEPISALPASLNARVIALLTSLPMLADEQGQRAFMYAAGLDAALQAQIRFGLPLAEFVPLLVATVVSYGNLQDGRYAMQAVLETAKQYIGRDRQAVCESLIQEIHAELNSASAHSQNQPGTPCAAGKPAGAHFGNLSFGSVSGNVNVVQAGGDIHGDVVAGNNTITKNDRDDA